MAKNMSNKNIEESEKQQPASAKRQIIGEEYGGEPLASVLRNPKLTPTILFIFAVAPFAIATVVLAVIFLSRQSVP
ncbi:hypothetical protein G7B40_015430 [Aetokthonos hydrillicola Thurmond2011]|uniref:Uncharacterized protein n=1 Tax=Aetokthonos hydrillicola Thurmond2011 TaxID=2712845 RepID=A0AAP5I8Z7_9CYAN|nr:hypothetical protein [Aetokthonos hydrillicola]MBO3461665.1 hypothetical protein [Aetokthonos hydrillicola CCALA 1050]MBW4588722.1 hypothetical protein [Aetokthonos hydrillicola CCALA 1050]MDR9895944.1 hypothetical protein [Aetokthonos hydrillicola Thurmond2011]